MSTIATGNVIKALKVFGTRPEMITPKSSRPLYDQKEIDPRLSFSNTTKACFRNDIRLPGTLLEPFCAISVALGFSQWVKSPP